MALTYPERSQAQFVTMGTNVVILQLVDVRSVSERFAGFGRRPALSCFIPGEMAGRRWLLLLLQACKAARHDYAIFANPCLGSDPVPPPLGSGPRRCRAGALRRRPGPALGRVCGRHGPGGGSRAREA